MISLKGKDCARLFHCEGWAPFLMAHHYTRLGIEYSLRPVWAWSFQGILFLEAFVPNVYVEGSDTIDRL